MKVSYKILALFAGATLLVGLGVLVMFSALRQIEESARARKFSFTIIHSAEALLSALKDGETGERGFVITGDEAFLGPYLAVRDTIPRQMQELRQFVLSSDARKHLDTLVPLVDAKLIEMEQIVRLRRTHDMPAMLATVSDAQNKGLMDAIRTGMTAFIQIEERDLATNDVALQSNMRYLFTVMVAASLFVLLFALAFAFLVYRETRHQFRNLVHSETRQLFETQVETNKQLHKANLTLQLSEEKLAVTLNSIGDAVIASDELGNVTLLNPLAEKLTGWTQAEAAGRPVDEIFHIVNQNTRVPTMVPVMDTLTNGTVHGLSNHTVLIAVNGSECAIANSCAPIRDRSGKVVGTVLVFRDVTEEEALFKAGALQNAIFNSANFSSIATDAKGVIQIFNVGAERMLGYAAAEVMNKITPADISDPQELIVRAKALSAELSTPISPGFDALVFKASRGIEDIYELTYIRKDGSRFPAVVSVTALRDTQNAIIGYLLIGTDNTARKLVEAEQRKLDQRLRDQQFYTRSLIESNIDAIMTTDPSGIITDANKQMEALTGCTRDELIGAPFKNYFTDPTRAEAAIKLVLSEKKVTDFELTACALDGKKTEVSYNATTFYDRDRTLQGVFAAARDVTERKRDELALQETNVALESAKSAAEKANLAKSDFLSSMSHELRSPLNAILGFAQLMESASPLPTASQKESIAQILQAGWHLLKLINEILDLAVIESGKVSLSRESVSLAEVMSECRAMMEPQAQQRGISMTFPRFDDDAPFHVKADRTRLKQIIINLLSNAIKYNKEHGTVIVDCILTAPGRVRISVADTGAGLSPEKLAQLFQPFNRLGQEVGAVAGTGIGLVVTKRLAELMEGALGVESIVGEGSVFWCELISAAAPQMTLENNEAGASIALQAPVGAVRQTLLYVEDNPANMNLVEQIVARHPGIRLVTAVNGTLGIEMARAAQPKVILMDINLPDMSGIEALKILSADPATAHIPVVALSANAMPRDIAKGLEVGFFRYVTKPIKVNELMDTLNAAFEFVERGGGMTANKEIIPSILIVDDTPTNVLLLERMLAQRGYKVRSVLSGKLALAAARAEVPDLILLDIAMPEMNGYEVCKQLKTDAVLKEIPVIFISALNETIDKVKAFSVGGVDYVTKPFQFEEVYARVQTHLQLRKLEKLRDDLTHMVVHDLRNPLSVIFGFLDILDKEVGKLTPSARTFLPLARLCSEEMLSMIGSILDVSKMGAGEMKLQSIPCDLTSLIRTLLAKSTSLPGHRTVTFNEPESPSTVTADAGLIRRVVQNLLSNALKHSPAGGVVSIVILPASSEIRVSVTDTGPGIAARFHERIFEKFSQLEDGNQHMGTGLGLTFCKLAVEAHGGSIGVESELGKGCTFWFALPRLNGSKN